MDISYLKTDGDKFINEQTITWVKKMGDCLKISTIQTDYYFLTNVYYICKSNNINSYNKLNDKLKD